MHKHIWLEILIHLISFQDKLTESSNKTIVDIFQNCDEHLEHLFHHFFEIIGVVAISGKRHECWFSSFSSQFVLAVAHVLVIWIWILLYTSFLLILLLTDTHITWKIAKISSSMTIRVELKNHTNAVFYLPV